MGVGILVPIDPMVYLIVAFIVIVGGACCATLGENSSEESNKKSNKKPPKVKYQPYKPNSKYKYKQRKQPKNFSHESTIQWKNCEECGHRINKVAKKCPYCGYEF